MPTAQPEHSPSRSKATVAEARALAHPLRLRIIRLLYDRSLTNRELARALGENPATVLHHVRTLLRNGFIEPDTERRGPRGNVEKPYRSTGRSWTVEIDDEHTRLGVSEAALDAFLAEVRDAQPNSDLSTSRLAVNLTPDALDELDELDRRFSALLQEYASKSPEAEGEPWSIFIALHRRATPALDGTVATSTPVVRTRATEPSTADATITECASDAGMAALLVRAQWAELSARYGEPEPAPEPIRNPSAFTRPNGTFVLLNVGDDTVACGGVCRYDDATAELKGIYVAPLYRGHGYSHLVLDALETRAVALGYRAARLETGDAQPEAIALYTSRGYTRIENFGVYRDLPRSLCFERHLPG